MLNTHKYPIFFFRIDAISADFSVLKEKKIGYLWLYWFQKIFHELLLNMFQIFNRGKFIVNDIQFNHRIYTWIIIIKVQTTNISLLCWKHIINQNINHHNIHVDLSFFQYQVFTSLLHAFSAVEKNPWLFFKHEIENMLVISFRFWNEKRNLFLCFDS